MDGPQGKLVKDNSTLLFFVYFFILIVCCDRTLKKQENKTRTSKNGLVLRIIWLDLGARLGGLNCLSTGRLQRRVFIMG